MTNNCIIKTLKASVDKNNLNPIGAVKIHLINESGSNVVRVLQARGYESADIINNTGGCYFTNTNGDNLGTHTVPSGDSYVMRVTNGECDVVIRSKYDLEMLFASKTYNGMYISGESYTGENVTEGIEILNFPINPRGTNALNGNFNIGMKVKTLTENNFAETATISYTFKYPSYLKSITIKGAYLDLPNIAECVNLETLSLNWMYKDAFPKESITYLTNLKEFNYSPVNSSTILDFYTSVESLVNAYRNATTPRLSATDFIWGAIANGIVTFNGSVIGAAGDNRGHISWTTNPNTITFTLNGNTTTINA